MEVTRATVPVPLGRSVVMDELERGHPDDHVVATALIEPASVERRWAHDDQFRTSVRHIDHARAT